MGKNKHNKELNKNLFTENLIKSCGYKCRNYTAKEYNYLFEDTNIRCNSLECKSEFNIFK